MSLVIVITYKQKGYPSVYKIAEIAENAEEAQDLIDKALTTKAGNGILEDINIYIGENPVHYTAKRTWGLTLKSGKPTSVVAAMSSPVEI